MELPVGERNSGLTAYRAATLQYQCVLGLVGFAIRLWQIFQFQHRATDEAAALNTKSPFVGGVATQKAQILSFIEDRVANVVDQGLQQFTEIG